MPKLAENAYPKYRRKKCPSGDRAVVELSGEVVSLGAWDSPESRQKYRRLVAEWVAGGRKRAPSRPGSGGITVGELAARFRDAQLPHYRKRGKPTTEGLMIGSLCAELEATYGDVPAAGFGPSKLEVLRDGWIRRGWTRPVVNGAAQRLRRVFRWGVAKELVPHAVLGALEAVEGLRKGRTPAPEQEEVGPVPEGHLEAVLPLVPPKAAAALRVMDLTAMRPAEVLAMRPCDLDRSGPTWRYRVRADWNKGAHASRGRVVPVGPQAQAVLAPWIEKAERWGPTSWVFPSVRVAGPMTTAAVRKAVGRACSIAKIPHWYPYALRHSAATRIRRAYGLDGAQVVLGHANAKTSEIYAEKDMKLAEKIASEMG